MPALASRASALGDAPSTQPLLSQTMIAAAQDSSATLDTVMRVIELTAVSLLDCDSMHTIYDLTLCSHHPVRPDSRLGV